MERVKVLLDEREFSALVRLAERELRPVPDQIRAVLRERLRAEGLLEQKQEAGRCDN